MMSRDCVRGGVGFLPGRIADRRNGGRAEHSGLDREVAALSRAGSIARRARGRRGMNEDRHARAQEWIAQERVEGISQGERDWLSAHLRDCPNCAEFARETEQALRALRTAAIPLPSGLASRTQFRVRLRAQELREREPKRRALWLACAVSWVFGVASAPYVWSLFQWLGQRTGLPKMVWEVGFGLWWSIPALFAVAVLLMESSRKGEQTDWINQGS